MAPLSYRLLGAGSKTVHGVEIKLVCIRSWTCSQRLALWPLTSVFQCWRTFGIPENDVHFILSAMVTDGMFLSRMSTVFLPINLFASAHSPILTHSSFQPCPQTWEKPFRITDLIVYCSCLETYSVPGCTAYFSCPFPWCTRPCQTMYLPLEQFSILSSLLDLSFLYFS